MSPQPTRLFVIHRHRIFCDTLRRALLDRDDVVLVGGCSAPRDAGGPLSHARPLSRSGVDVLLIDARMPSGRVAEMITELTDDYPELAVLVVGVEEGEVVEMIEAGARGYLPADTSLDRLLDGVVALRAGRAHCSTAVAAAAFARLGELAERCREVPPLAAARELGLTGREQEVLQLVGAGLQNKEIAQRLHITLPTVKNHVHRILDKMSVKCRRDAVQVACESGLVDDRVPLHLDLGDALAG